MHAAVDMSRVGVGTLPRPAAARSEMPDAVDLLEQFGTTVRMARDHEIHSEGSSATYCYRVVSGCVRTVRLMEDGRRQVGEFLLAGDLFGLDDLGDHAFSAEAVTEVVLRRYPRRMVESLAESHPALGRRLLELAFTHLRAAQERIVLLGRKTATERLATFMLEMDRRIRGGEMLEFPMCRADIADHLGLTVETVCRVLAQVKREGIISVTRSGVRLHNRAALRNLASETRH